MWERERESESDSQSKIGSIAAGFLQPLVKNYINSIKNMIDCVDHARFLEIPLKIQVCIKIEVPAVFPK